MSSSLQVVVRTPREIVVQQQVTSIRVPTETGQVGLRGRVEPLVLAIEPGLVLLRRDAVFQFVGTAGGLLRCDGEQANLLTPLAVQAADEDAVLRALENALAHPTAEIQVRDLISRLQSNILTELRQGRQPESRQPEGR